MLTGQIADTTSRLVRSIRTAERTGVPGNGAPASSFELNVTDQDFKFPQTWRSNIGVDRMLPPGLVATGEFLYNRDVNGIYYLNANLPAPQSPFAGSTIVRGGRAPACSGRPRSAPCVTRHQQRPGNQIHQAFVLQNQDIGRSWWRRAAWRSRSNGGSVKGAYSYGVARNTVDAGSAPFWHAGRRSRPGDPNNPAWRIRKLARPSRLLNASYTRQYFGLGATTVSAFFEARTPAPRLNFATTPATSSPAI